MLGLASLALRRPYRAAAAALLIPLMCGLSLTRMTLSSKSLSGQQIFDCALNFIRIRLFTIPGLSVPAPFGKQRQITVDLDPAARQPVKTAAR